MCIFRVVLIVTMSISAYMLCNFTRGQLLCLSSKELGDEIN